MDAEERIRALEHEQAIELLLEFLNSGVVDEHTFETELSAIEDMEV